MRNLVEGNKKSFTVFGIIVLVIIVLLIVCLLIVTKVETKQYEIEEGTYIYDKDYNLVDMDTSAIMKKKWDGNYYLTMQDNKKEYQLGKTVISYKANVNKLNTYGKMFRIYTDAKIEKIEEENEIQNFKEDRLYKIEDRKYLLVANKIKNQTGSLQTQNYLIIVLDKSGNTLLLNNEINSKTINPIILETETFKFDIANEKLIYQEQEIDLKKIIGSTNEYVEREKKEQNTITGNETTLASGQEQEENTINNEQIVSGNNQNQGISDYYNNQNNSNNQNGQNQNQQNEQNQTGQTGNGGIISGGVIQGGTITGGGTSQVDDITNNGNSGNNNEDSNNSTQNKTPLSKSVSLRGATSTSSYIDISYEIRDPESKYQTIYLLVEGDKEKTISLDKNATGYRITDLTPNTDYKITLGYKEIQENNKIVDVIEDVLIVRTTKIDAKIEIQKTTGKKVYFTVKLDKNYPIDSGKIVLYVDEQKQTELEIDIEKAMQDKGFQTSMDYTYGNEIKLTIEQAMHEGQEIKINTEAKFRNY